MTINVGFLIFPKLQQLDLTAPYEVFSCIPEIKVHLIAETMEPIKATSGLSFQPDMVFQTACALDILCVPGGAGVNALMENENVLNFIRQQAKTVRYLSSVCTGSMVLGAAGLLAGRKATTHWSALEFLKYFGASPSHERVVQDGSLITAGGVTAGIDFGLVMLAELLGRDIAQKVQLFLQYDPQPPFDCGTPERAPQSVLKEIKESGKTTFQERLEIVHRWKMKPLSASHQ